MASIREMDQSLDGLETSLRDILGEVMDARDTIQPRVKSERLKVIQTKLFEAARILPFDITHN